ncbi:MAG TPA: insulinase family protein [Candidatus Onthocola stercorigallinarum]|nr:insulinase family protein [Candidatus Onthocola stercorigallinarum]
MVYKTYKCNSYNIHTIKTDRFKTVHMEIIFRKNIVKEELVNYAFLVDMLMESSKNYPKRKDVITKLEELYKLVVYGTTVKTGNVLNSNFMADFIDPKFIDEEDYLENVIKFIFEMLMNPNATNEEFDLKEFNFVKERLKREIKSIDENPFKSSMRKAIEAMDKSSVTAFPLMGSVEELDDITPSSLYKYYKKLFKDNTCDIFIIGNVDSDNIVSLIQKYFKHRYIYTNKLVLRVDNKEKKKVTTKEDVSENLQANLVMIYNIGELPEVERHVTMQVFNYIFGSGGLTSKLYKRIREENSLCYNISTLYLKYDELLAIHISLDTTNVKKAISMVKKCLKEMQNGEFLDSDLEDAKKSISLALDLTNDNNSSLLNNYVFHEFDNLPLIDERKKSLAKLTKEDVVNVAKKLKLNTIYVLKGKENE